MKDEKEIVGTEADMEDSRIYEAAFHIVPSLDEAGVAEEVADIKKFLVSNGANIIGSGEPMLMALAYEVQKDIDRKRHTFSRAYFAWFVFEATPESVHAIKEMLGSRVTLVRSLLIKTSKDAAIDRRHPALLATPSTSDTPVVEESVVDGGDEVPPLVLDEDKKSMDVDKVDAEIAKLVVE